MPNTALTAARGSLSHAGLPPEALALVDLLVLTGARRFAGSVTSPFTWAVQVRYCRRPMAVPAPNVTKSHKFCSFSSRQNV